MTTKMLPILFLLITACATPYQPRQGGGEAGFSDISLSETTREIRVNGNKYTSRAQIHEMAFLRAAELARDNGYQFVAFKTLESWLVQTVYETSGAHQQMIVDQQSVTDTDITLEDHTEQGSGIAAYTPRADRTSRPQLRLVVEFQRKETAEQASFVKVSDIIDKYAQKYDLSE